MGRTVLQLTLFNLRYFIAQVSFFQAFRLFLILKSVFTPRLVLAGKHERSVPCDTDLSETNQKAPWGGGGGV